MKIDDILGIEEAWYFYEVSLATGPLNRRKAPFLFATNPDVSMSNPRRGVKRYGHDFILKQFWDDTIEKRPNNFFYTGDQITTPLIQVDEDGIHAKAMFPTAGFFAHSTRFEEAPCKVESTFECWFGDFIKEDGVWKMLHFNWLKLLGEGVWAWDTATDNGYAVREALHELGAVPFDIHRYGYDPDIPWPGGLPEGKDDPRIEERSLFA